MEFLEIHTFKKKNFMAKLVRAAKQSELKRYSK